jgi:hypothetical protein
MEGSVKKGNPIAGYALLVLLVFAVGLVITTVARDMMRSDRPPEIAAPETKDQSESEKPAAPQSNSKPRQGRIWEGTM